MSNEKTWRYPHVYVCRTDGAWLDFTNIDNVVVKEGILYLTIDTKNVVGVFKSSVIAGFREWAYWMVIKQKMAIPEVPDE